MLSKILKFLLLMVIIVDLISAASPQQRSLQGGGGGGRSGGRGSGNRGGGQRGDGGQKPYPYFQPHNNPNEPNYGPIMISNLPVVPNSAADYGNGRSMDAYLAQVDRELAMQSSERHKPKMRSMLRSDGWIESQPGDEMNIPLQTASPDIPPDVIAYFEKSRKNDLALAAAIEKAENVKIDKEMYWIRNKVEEKPWKDSDGSGKGSQPGRRRSLGKSGGKKGKGKENEDQEDAGGSGEGPQSGRRRSLGKSGDKKGKGKENEQKKDKFKNKDNPKQRSGKGKLGSKDKKNG